MMKAIVAVLVLLAAAAPLAAGEEAKSAAAPQPERKTGLIRNETGAFEGYTLFAPIGSTATYLIDMDGRVVKEWKSDYEPGQSAYLLSGGRLLRTARYSPEDVRTFRAGGAGGRVQVFSFEGELEWDFVYAGADRLLHHDVAPMPNGNMLMIAWELKAPREAAAAGRNPEMVSPEGLWSDHDQIVLSVQGFDEIWIIDHSPTTAEAAGHTGGRGGKGGDLLYRWGNPAAYGRGSAADQRLFAQHDAPRRRARAL